MSVSALTRSELGTSQLSYAAGSTSLDPDGYRLIGETDDQRLTQLKAVFPHLDRILSAESLFVSAYPAALGLQGVAPFVDTYLHPPTFIRAIRLAARDSRTVFLAAQPLIGADLLMRVLRHGFELPREVLWANGGYYFPRSLEYCVREQLRSVGCHLEVLHCYGAAEIGHTCFAAIDRFESGFPRYRKIADHVEMAVSKSGRMVLKSSERQVITEDCVENVGDHLLIRNGSARLCAEVLSELESWKSAQWSRRTGYLRASATGSIFQLREWVETQQSTDELRYHEFWQKFGGSPQSKPQWNRLNSSCRPTEPA